MSAENAPPSEAPITADSTIPAKAQIPAKARVHLGYLDGIRGLAALYVALGHALLQAFPLFTRPGTYPDLHAWKMLGVLREGHDAVSIFIVLSGFCLMIPVTRAGGILDVGWKTFIKKRFVRIIPTYYASLIISLILATTIIAVPTGTHWDVAIPVTRADVITHFLLIQDVFASTAGKINHVFWSISVEWRIYFLFPFLVIACRKFGMAKTSLATFIICAIIWKALRHAPVYSSLTIQYVALFVFGMMGCQIVFGSDETVGKWRTLPWKVIWPILCALYIASIVIGVPALVRDTLCGLFGISMIISIGLTPHSRFGKALSWKPVAWLGVVGYSLYLMHAPILQIVQIYVLRPLGMNGTSTTARLETFFVLATFGIGVALVCIWLFYLAFEKPFTLMTKRITQKATGVTKEVVV